ncbi:MAG: DUF5667 domain-containing protein, partial [Nanoarchaeota archaeon]|nr:DUF5667 domain-containing protein [Nanoarchaeota archaeon]
IGTIGFVMAEESTNESTAQTIEPHKVGFFENAFDGFRFKFAFNKEKKIEIALERAEKRLAEAELVFGEDPEKIAAAQEKYDAFVAEAEEILAKIAENQADDGNESMENLEKITRIQNKFEKHRAQSEKIYTRALEKFEENNASEEKIERFESFYERALNRSDEMEERALQNKENAIKRHKALSEMSDNELQGLVEKIDSKEGLTQARVKRIEQEQVRVQKFAKIKNQEIVRAQIRLNNSDLTAEQRKRIEERIKNVNQKIERYEERAMQEPRQAEMNIVRKTEMMRKAIQEEIESREYLDDSKDNILINETEEYINDSDNELIVNSSK